MLNQEAYFAEEFALNTSQSFFLTGKAGTGKTTLLRNILLKTNKNTIVVAPTGVAAINAGGVTIHSMFGLPLTSFIPNNDFVDLNVANNRSSLKRHMRFKKEKRKLLQELDLLIIDEVSMVRADLLDAIDFILQEVRQNREAFGGLQVIFIGDLYQLPPVVREESWALLKEYYESPYFFDSYAWKNAHAFILELKHIYRQQDEDFISILNNVRNGDVSEFDIENLNEHYDKLIGPNKNEYITICTHNHQADSINQLELSRLITPSYSFKAKIEGNFNENAYPADLDISIKEGAQIMFIRNDVENKQYYNGKLATVASIGSNFIKVRFLEDGELFTLKEEVWENIHYTLDKESNEVKQEKLGSFTQYPIRLAWAITVHKSQGLTFKKAIIDLGKSFAPGQAYVALSRCTDLEGLVLKSRISAKNIFIDERIVNFHREYKQDNNFEKALLFAKEEYAKKMLFKTFNFLAIREEIEEWRELISAKELPEKDKCVLIAKNAFHTWLNLQDVEQKFKLQLQQIFRSFDPEKDKLLLLQRCEKAIVYFTEEIFTKLIYPLNEHINEFVFKNKTKAYVAYCREIQLTFWAKMNQMYNLHYLENKVFTGDTQYHPKQLKNADVSVENIQKKGATYEITLEMFKKGDTILEIAQARNMATSTIEQHLTKWVGEGRLSVYDLIDETRVDKITPFILKQEDLSISKLKEEIPFETTFSELRHVLAHLEWEKKTKG